MDKVLGVLGIGNAAEKKDPWRCKVCSYENHPLLPACEMCDNPQGTEPTPTPPATPKMTPLVMGNKDNDVYKNLPEKEKEKEKEKEEVSPLAAQLQSSKEAMDASKLNRSLEEDKLRAVFDFSNAASTGDVVKLRFLLQNFSSEDLDVPGALHSAAEHGHYEAVKTLVEAKYDVNALLGNVLTDTPLSLAAAGGHLQVVEYLLQKGGDVNKYGPSQTGPLFYAIQNGHTRVVEALLARHASLSTGFAGKTPLLVACEGGHTDIAKLLIAKGVDVNQPGGEHQYTPLHAAAKLGHLALVALLLLQPKINVEAQDANERLPLQYALQTGVRVQNEVEGLITAFWLEQFDTLQGVRDTWKPEQMKPIEKEVKEKVKEGDEEESLVCKKKAEKEQRQREKHEREEAERIKKLQEDEKRRREAELQQVPEQKDVKQQTPEQQPENDSQEPKEIKKETHSNKEEEKKSEQEPKETEKEAAKEKEDGELVVIKLSDGENMRRFSLGLGADKRKNFDTFFASVGQVLDAPASNGNITVKYKDEEGDLITICTDEDLAEAIRFIKGKQPANPILHVYVKL